MEVGPIDPIRTTEKSLAAWLVVREALEGATPPGVDEAPPPESVLPIDRPGLEPETDLTVPVSEPLPPGADIDFSHEAATVQTTWRAPTPAVDVPHRSDEAVPAMPAAQSEFSVPEALLVPAMLTGLKVEPALGWAQLPPGATQWPVSREQREGRRQRRERDGLQEPAPEEASEPPPRAATRDEHAPPDRVIDAADAGAWCDALTRALRTALAARVVPQALLAAADQWQRGRCVVLACPQGDDPAGPAWAFVLWPILQAQQATGAVTPELALRGLQVDARLQWSAPPGREQWCHVRVVKEHHPRTGRQLVALDEAGSSADSRRPLPCEVQVGPVLARSLRWCEVRVRIQAAQRFWNALGAQWSVHVVVSAQPLIAPPATLHGGSPC